ncbi:hypothetical protein ACFZCP_41230 [Streptomyces sp. NPDC007971]|uniref:hypothetical protein n=1 Tax=Streptomyces sp. NPDC007971 TaxID=3364799 RepID=UPI0036EC5E13
MLPESLIKAEIKLREADDDLAAALAHGTDEEKREARKAWRAALRDKRNEVKLACEARRPEIEAKRAELAKERRTTHEVF